MALSLNPKELKNSLRKKDFPASTRYALSQIEMICSANFGRPQSLHNTDLASELIAEFVFYEIDRRGMRNHEKPTHIHQLRLLTIFCDFFSVPTIDEASKNAVFMLLFTSTNQERAKLLVKLVSLAMHVGNSQVLRATGVQMQQLSCTSQYSLQLAQAVVSDFIILLPDAASKLKDMPKISPLFTANFLTAITEMYFNTESTDLKPPPKILLEVITQWVENYNNVCTAALSENLQPALPTGAIPMPAITPYAGLIKWCVLSPLYETDPEVNRLYSTLHLCLLNSLFKHDWNQNEGNLISVQALTAIIHLINQKQCNEEQKEKSIVKLAQIISVALFAKSIYGNMRKI
uniref:Uncharacterized protein n=1 Tax=Clastoptera arizonana TaxID=38151 RepID=A0A1B6DVE1_9HEMI